MKVFFFVMGFAVDFVSFFLFGLYKRGSFDSLSHGMLVQVVCLSERRV